MKPNDDIIDVLGFLAFEVVRELTVGAVSLKQCFEEDSSQIKRLNDGSQNRKDLVESGKALSVSRDTHTGDTSIAVEQPDASADMSTDTAKQTQPDDPSAKPSDSAQEGDEAKRPIDHDKEPCGLFTMPPAKSSPLLSSHVREAFARLQRNRSFVTSGGGTGTGGLKRTRVFVI